MLRHEESIVVILFKVQIVTALSSFLTGQSTKVGYTSDQSQYHTSPVQNVIQCQTLCSYQPLCITFNYNVRSRSCGLTLGGDPQVGDDVVVTSKPSEPPGVVSAKCSDTEVFVRKKTPPGICLPLLDIDCGSPPDVASASHTLSFTNFRSTTEYACKEGHVQTGGNNRTTCLFNGTWSEVTLTCMVIDCGLPPTMVELNVMVTSTSYNSTATYVCREGYDDYGGSGISTCTDGSIWSTIDLNCTIVDCGLPPYQDGAMVDYVNTTFGAEANSICVKGYSSSGNGTSVCLSNGTWSQTDLVCTASSHSTWQHVATTTASATPSGQRDDLNTRIVAACKPKFRVKAEFDLWNRVTDLHSCGAKSGPKIWGQSVRRLSKSSWDAFEPSPQREFDLFVSDAQNNLMSVDDGGIATKSGYDGDFIWFVKDDQCVSTSSANDIGSVLTSLFEGEIDPNFDTYDIDDSNSTVYGQVTSHLSQSSLPTFKIPFYWYVKKQGTSGKTDVIRWDISGGFRSTSTGSATMPWCPDTCWHHAFDTRASSSNKDKHIRHLTNGVQHGHNIMLKVGNVVAKSREVILHDGHVTVSIKEFWVPSDKDAFSSGSRQAWIMASTTGRDVQCIHVPESAVVENVTEGGKPSIWFLDSRQWDKVFTIDGTGAVLSGSMSDLLNKVNEGRSLRVGVLHTNGMYKALEVDAVDVSSTGQIAVDIIHNVDLVLGRGNDFHFTDTCGVVSSIITTEGRYKTYRSNIGSAGNHSTVNDVAKIDWFVEM